MKKRLGKGSRAQRIDRDRGDNSQRSGGGDQNSGAQLFNKQSVDEVNYVGIVDGKTELLMQ